MRLEITERQKRKIAQKFVVLAYEKKRGIFSKRLVFGFDWEFV